MATGVGTLMGPSSGGAGHGFSEYASIAVTMPAPENVDWPSEKAAPAGEAEAYEGISRPPGETHGDLVSVREDEWVEVSAAEVPGQSQMAMKLIAIPTRAVIGLVGSGVLFGFAAWSWALSSDGVPELLPRGPSFVLMLGSVCLALTAFVTLIDGLIRRD